MSMHMTGLCREHSFESAAELCRRCGLEYCEGCVVYPFGSKKPLCKTCAIAMSGVRSHTGLPAMAPRLVKKRAKAFAANVGSTAGAPMAEPVVPEVRDTTVDAIDEAVAEPASTLPPPPRPDQAPVGADANPLGSDVAPPIDWSQPFG